MDNQLHSILAKAETLVKEQEPLKVYKLKKNMIKLTQNLVKATSTIELPGAPIKDALVYRKSEARFLYNERIIEIHSDGVFVAVLPMDQTATIFINS
jgi:hypothetical protein